MASHPPASPSPPASAPSAPPPRPPEAAEDDPNPGAAASSAAAASPAGFIFICSGATKAECYRHRVLGLPRGRLEAVSRIRRGAAVFLYDLDIKRLYGPYRADSDGGADLVPGAFHGRFPAQVKFMIDGDFMPLPESSIKSAIKENYFKGKFSPELTSTQVENLRALFQPITLLPESSPPCDVDNWPPAPAFLPPSAHPAQPPPYAHHPTTYAAPATSIASQPSPPAPASLLSRKRTHSFAVAAEDDAHPGASSSTASASPAGFIFMCSGATKPDCYHHRVLGLPRGSLEAVSRIRRGATLFLYDFDAKHLYGPYHADSDGGADLVPSAFRGRFPAQVKFMIDGDFMPIPESSLRNAIKENYFKGKFSPELTSTQVEKLRALFQPITSFPQPSSPRDVDNWPPGPAFLPPALPAQPPAYTHNPTAFVAPPAAHIMPPEACAPPCSYLPLSTQPASGYGYQAGYAACGPMPYQATYGVGHDMVAANLQQVGYYGSTPSNLNATPGAAISGFVRISTSCDEEDAADDSGTPQSRASPLIDLSPRSCGTPMSSGSKRTAGSTRSTASSPGKKPKNAAVRSMNTNMTRFNSSYGHRTEVIENIWFKKNMSVEQKMSMKQQEKESRKQKQQTRKEEQKLVVQSAKELGVHQMATKLWKGVINICKDDDARTIFLMTPSEQRVAMIEDYAAMDINAPVHHEVDATTDSEEEWWDEFVSMVLLDDDEAPFIYAMYEYATHVDTCEQVLQ